MGIDHARAGELVCVAEPGCWFAYHYWLDEARRPDFATTVDIPPQAGLRPDRAVVDPKLKVPQLKVARVLARKKLGFRYLMDVISTDPSLVRGSHGRLFETPDAGPVCLSSSADGGGRRGSGDEVRDRLLGLLQA